MKRLEFDKFHLFASRILT